MLQLICIPETPSNDTLTYSEDTDEMPHDAAFHLCLHCLPRQNRSMEKEILYVLESITCDPLYIQWIILT